MVDENYGFRDDDERKAFYIALPVLALFGALLYYFVFTPEDTITIDSDAAGDVAFLDSDADGIADHLDRCINEQGTLDNHGCLLSPDKDKDDLNKDKDKDALAAVKQQPAQSSMSSPDTTAAPLVEETRVEKTSADTVELIEPVSEPIPAQAPAPAPEVQTPEIQAPEIQTPNIQTPEIQTPVVPTPEVAPTPVVDTDADGIPDAEDECPDTVGSNNGCPAESAEVRLPTDTDIDGVADQDDKCPDIAGSAQNAGCPESTTNIALTPEEPVTESEERLIQDAGFNIQFNAGNSVLTGRSREILLEVAKVMQRYPDIRLEAHGFTDAEGPAEANKSLSQQRAQSCIDVIAEAGIDRERLKALGFGEAQPIASNSTAVGRQKNRRVEFKLVR